MGQGSGAPAQSEAQAPRKVETGEEPFLRRWYRYQGGCDEGGRGGDTDEDRLESQRLPPVFIVALPARCRCKLAARPGGAIACLASNTGPRLNGTFTPRSEMRGVSAP